MTLNMINYEGVCAKSEREAVLGTTQRAQSCRLKRSLEIGSEKLCQSLPL